MEEQRAATVSGAFSLREKCELACVKDALIEWPTASPAW